MIKLKLKLGLKYYLIGNLFRLRKSYISLWFLIFFLLFLFFAIWAGISSLISYIILFFVLIYIFIPILSWAIVNFYHKINFIEYFFDDDVFWHTLWDYKSEMKRDKIDFMRKGNSYIFVKYWKSKLFFIGDKDGVNRINKELMDSKYKDFFINKNK